jgi:hypothetical protein
MGFLSFVNQGGKRVVRWPRIVVMWIAGIPATLFGACTMDYILTGDWRNGVFIGIVAGVFIFTVATVLDFTRTPVEKLPPAP